MPVVIICIENREAQTSTMHDHAIGELAGITYIMLMGPILHNIGILGHFAENRDIVTSADIGTVLISGLC